VGHHRATERRKVDLERRADRWRERQLDTDSAIADVNEAGHAAGYERAEPHRCRFPRPTPLAPAGERFPDAVEKATALNRLHEEIVRTFLLRFARNHRVVVAADDDRDHLGITAPGAQQQVHAVVLAQPHVGDQDVGLELIDGVSRVGERLRRANAVAFAFEQFHDCIQPIPVVVDYEDFTIHHTASAH
jgi:hypothetical protein